MKVRKVFIILPIIILVVALFYWYEWRPIQIRKNCTNSVEKQFYDAWLYGQQNYVSMGNKAFEKQSQLDYIGRAELRKRCLESEGLR